ncbi:MAG TPA: DNA polymerase III subunit gamma and tau [Trebonia sp.]
MAADSHATGTGRGDEAPRQSLALYRKYRPATFAEVRGQDHVTEPLRQALRSGRINHAYLFSGPRGCGKTSSARILARSLNCVNGPTPDPCGVCDSCVALGPSGPGSIDVIEIDAASHGGVDDARDLRERAFYAPVAGRYKIYIIDEAHMVTQQGFNALLKLVEEPPPHLKFIFATTEPEKVIPTIRSRTHHYPFRLMPPSVMRELAEEILNSEHVPFDPAVLPLVVRAGGGSARDSLSILDQLLAGSDEGGITYARAVALLGFTDASLLDEIVDAFAAADGGAVFRAVNRVIEGGHEPRRFATDMLDRFRDLIVLASVPDAISSGLLDVPPDRADALRGQAERYGLASLTRAADIVAVGLDQMRGATSPRLLLELMCAQVLLPAAASDERSLLARLERLEASAAGAGRPAAGGAGQEHPERTRPAPSPSMAPAGGQASAAAQPAPAAPAPQAGERPASADLPPAAQARPQPQAPGEADGAGSAAAQSPSAQPSVSDSPAAQPRPPASGTQPQAPAAAEAQPSAASQRPAPAFTHAPGAAVAPAAAAGPRGSVTVDVLRQAWPGVVEAIKAKGRVAAIVIGNASVASFDEGVLTLRFPRQGDVKGFQGSKYEDLLKQAIAAMFGVNVVIRAVTGGGDAPSPARRPGPPSAPSAPNGQQPSSPGQPSPDPQAPGQQAPGRQAPGQSPDVPRPDYPSSSAAAGPGVPPAALPSGQPYGAGPGSSGAGAGQPWGAGNGTGSGTPSFGGPVSAGGDLPPLPPPPSPDDEDFDPDDEDMSAPAISELTGMALIQRELGAEIIAEYDD